MPPSTTALHFATALRARLDPFLPSPTRPPPHSRPHVTLTYAISLDSQIAAAPGTQTILSGPASKAMTHYLRTRHDAILVGSGTACADDPTLTSRLDDAIGNPARQPRPVVLDRRGRWDVGPSSKVVQAASSGAGKGPWVVLSPDSHGANPAARAAAVQGCGGEFVAAEQADLPGVLALLHARGIGSVMIEGGAEIINGMLSRHQDLIDALIITIAPVYLGRGGVQIVPPKDNATAPAVVRLRDTAWIPLEADVVMCGHVDRSDP